MGRTLAAVAATIILSEEMTVVTTLERLPERPVERESTALSGLGGNHNLIRSAQIRRQRAVVPRQAWLQ